MNLKRGVYEQVINKYLNEAIEKNINDIELYKDEKFNKYAIDENKLLKGIFDKK